MAINLPRVCDFKVIKQGADEIIIQLSGALSMQTAQQIWQSCLEIQSHYHPQRFLIDASRLEYCDSAGIALFQILSDRQQSAKHQFTVQGLNQQLQDLYDMTLRLSGRALETTVMQGPGLIISMGKFVVESIQIFKSNIAFLGELFYFSVQALKQPERIRWRDTIYLIEIVGPNAIPIVFLIGFLFGLIMAFQSAIQLRSFGADIYVANLVGVALAREFGPLMTAIVLISRSSSAFAAEIGTMKINQEVDALKTMGLEPMAFLVIPRLIAAVIMTPLLNIFMIFFGLIGCGIVMKTLGYSLPLYLNQLQQSVWMSDFVGGMVKAVVFGVIVAGVGCMHGLRTKSGASAVGDSTTRAVVSGIMMLAFVDGIFSILYYIMGV